MPAALADHDDQFDLIVERSRDRRHQHRIERAVQAGGLLVEPHLRGRRLAPGFLGVVAIVEADAENLARAGQRAPSASHSSGKPRRGLRGRASIASMPAGPAPEYPQDWGTDAARPCVRSATSSPTIKPGARSGRGFENTQSHESSSSCTCQGHWTQPACMDRYGAVQFGKRIACRSPLRSSASAMFSARHRYPGPAFPARLCLGGRGNRGPDPGPARGFRASTDLLPRRHRGHPPAEPRAVRCGRRPAAADHAHHHARRPARPVQVQGRGSPAPHA